MPWLEAFCSVKLFPFQPKDPPTKKVVFFPKRSFFWLHLGFYDFRKMRVEEVIYEKDDFSSSIFTFSKGDSLVFLFCCQAYQRNKGLAATWQDLWSNERSAGRDRVSHTTRFLSTSPPFARIADFYKACIFFPYKSCLEKQSSYSLPLSPTNLSIHVSPFL